MNRPDNDPQLEKELQELYILAGHRASGLDFLEEELRFLTDSRML